VIPEAAFVDDLYADSIRLVELLVTMEEQGIEIPFEEAWNIKTVGMRTGCIPPMRPTVAAQESVT